MRSKSMNGVGIIICELKKCESQIEKMNWLSFYHVNKPAANF